MAFPQNPTIGDTFTYGGKTFRWDGGSWSKIFSGISSDFYPSVNEGFSLGTASKKWGNLHISGNTILLGDTRLESSGEGGLAIKSTNTQVTSAIAFSSNGYIAAPSGPLATSSGAVSTSPRISNVQVTDSSYVVLDDTAANSGGYVSINGSNFDSGATVVVGTQSANSVSFVNSSKLNVALPSLTAGTYTVYVTNSDGSTALRINGLSISGSPTWTTAAGSIASAYESLPLTVTVNAVSDTAVVYSLLSGSLPTGANLNPGNGNIFVTSTALTNSNTTFNFTLNATDAEQQNTTRAFSATVLTDGVRWVKSNVNESIISPNTSSFSYTLNAISLSGRTLSYAANSLPSGITLSGNVLSGTFSSVANTMSIVTANTSVTNKSNLYNLYFEVQQALLAVEYMVVAGGGGGGGTGSGGGAGGVLCCTGQIGSATYAIVVGAGGAAGGGLGNGSNGGNSSAFGTTTYGGGGGVTHGGASAPGAPGGCGAPGGSGGGGSIADGGSAGCGGRALYGSSQGYPGGNSHVDGGYSGGSAGGGGASAQGSDSNTSGAGAGGAGRSLTNFSSIGGSPAGCFGGGGGGAAVYGSNAPGGAGGGGNGQFNGVPGTACTGGGGGGGAFTNNIGYYSSGGSGGSGIVAVRYLISSGCNLTGGTISCSAGYKYHVFTSSGNLVKS